MGHKGYCIDGMLTRRVLLEKHFTENNQYIHIYTYPKMSSKNPYAHCPKQLDIGFSVAKKYGLEPIHQAELFLESNDKDIIGETLKTLLVCVSYKEIKHIFVEDIKLFCPNIKHRYLLNYIICFLILNDVRIYTKEGLLTFDYVDLRHINDKPFKYFFRLIYSNWNHSESV